jgi:hypothetical protein
VTVGLGPARLSLTGRGGLHRRLHEGAEPVAVGLAPARLGLAGPRRAAPPAARGGRTGGGGYSDVGARHGVGEAAQ